MGVILLSVIFLYRSGQLTSEKMQLQNAADAAAYSATTLEARALNFSAYTNRAMIGNEVAIGQIVGLLSLSREWVEDEEGMSLALGEIDGILAEIPVLGEILAVIIDTVFDGISSGLAAAGSALQDVLDVIAAPLIRGLSTVNEAYSVSQEIYHVATFALASDAILKCLEKNTERTDFDGNLITGLFAPGETNAQLSELGLIALAGHLPSYLVGFTHYYKTGSDSELEKKGMGRLAATIREGRDGFSSGIECGKSGRDRRCAGNGLMPLDGGVCCEENNPGCNNRNRDWHYGFDLGFNKSVKFISGGADLFLEAKSKGGSEIRYKDKQFVWSAVDTSVLGMGFSAEAYFFHKRIFHVDKDFNLPIGAGTSQATGKEVRLSPFNLPRDLRRDGTPGAYGGAAEDTFELAWPAAQLQIEETAVSGNPYGALRPYRGLTGEETGSYAFETPYFLVGVIRKIPAIEGRGPQFGTTYNLESGDKHFDRMGAVAQSEVYFSRPEDLSYFRRRDKYTERPNLFSPFWQSRLVKTGDLDRFLALALQQKVIWIADQDAGDIPGFDELIQSMKKLLNLLVLK